MESYLSDFLPISAATLCPFIFSLLALFLLWEQIQYLRKKRRIPGPNFVLPFLGNTVPLVRNPTKFWEDQARLARSSPLGVSANYLLGRFVLFLHRTDLSHKVFANVRRDAFLLIGHPFGKKLYGDHNLIYMVGAEHKDLRRRIAHNFTPRALSTYTALQQTIILRHLRAWEKLSSGVSPVPLRLLCRDMNLETSQTAFVGPYLSAGLRDRFNVDYGLFNVGLMALPVDLPGFGFREARLAVDRLIKTLGVCAGESRARMGREEEPACLMDFWMRQTVLEATAAREAGSPPPPHSSDAEIGGYVFDFLFAAQDASTSSLSWAVALLDSHPAVLARVRREVAGIWTPGSGGPITAEQLQEMRYTEAVAREVLRFRAPATLVPHIAGEDFALTESCTVPKGAIVFPSVYESSFQGFKEADRFDPDRFGVERQEDRVYKRNFLAFGAGAHHCVGQRYALNHLLLFIAMFSSLLDFQRHRTDGCDELAYVPTIVPKDDCLVFLSRRCARWPSLRKDCGEHLH